MINASYKTPDKIYYLVSYEVIPLNEIDGFWEFDLKPWDIAAGALLVIEAGGIIEDIYGKPNYLDSGNILAANPKVFKAMLQKIRPVLE
ncbi:MAG TPA: hypothetical protein ENJ60_02760 [Aeromonadales bacterium]|nr:hypothetical protein [Aeromonadales bacterium]